MDDPGEDRGQHGLERGDDARARGAGMCRSAATMQMNGSSVPTTTTPAPAAAFLAEPSSSNGKPHQGATTAQNRLAKPNAQNSVVTGSCRWPARSEPTM